jgi:hypothetical protein
MIKIKNNFIEFTLIALKITIFEVNSVKTINILKIKKFFES